MKFLSRFLRGDDQAEEAAAHDAREPEGVEPPGAAAAAADGVGGWNFGSLAPPPPQAAAAPEPSLVPDEAVTTELRPRIVEALKSVFDPEIPVDIYELGLIYDIQADAARRVHVKMTLTSPACPSAQQLPSEVRFKVKALQGVSDATVEVVWEPPWDKDRMSEVAKLHLGLF